MPIKLGLAAAAATLCLWLSVAPALGDSQSLLNTPPEKQYDLVLVHGLANWHHWSDGFLAACLELWGSGNVYAVYTANPDKVWTREIGGKTLVCAGSQDDGAGDGSIEEQSRSMRRSVEVLQANHGLGMRFNVIAHSMGGLVSRHFVYQNPGLVVSLVALGTPHHGSPLAESFQWTGLFVGAEAAMADLKPQAVKSFNQSHPVEGMPLVEGGGMYTVRGHCPGGDCWGWAGELQLGWAVLKVAYDTDSDGLVPMDSAVIQGCQLVADYPDYDHYDLVCEPRVARDAAAFCP